MIQLTAKQKFRDRIQAIQSQRKAIIDIGTHLVVVHGFSFQHINEMAANKNVPAIYEVVTILHTDQHKDD